MAKAPAPVAAAKKGLSGIWDDAKSIGTGVKNTGKAMWWPVGTLAPFALKTAFYGAATVTAVGLTAAVTADAMAGAPVTTAIASNVGGLWGGTASSLEAAHEMIMKA